MGRSARYTAKKYFDQTRLDISAKIDDSIMADRFNLMNRSQEWVQSNFGELVAPSFMTYATLTSDIVAKFYSSGASWDASTSRLTATMTVNFASTDVGKTINFGDGTNAYIGVISAYISTTVVEVSGYGLPSVDIATVTSVTVLATKFVSGDTISLSSLAILRYGENVKMSLQSTATKKVVLTDIDGLNNFDSDAPQNANMILYAIVGNEIRLALGDSMANAGTLSLNFPEIVHDVYSDTDNMDLLDGAMIQLGIVVCRQFILRRMGGNVSSDELNNAIANLYKSYGQSAVNEIMQSKSKLLLAGS